MLHSLDTHRKIQLFWDLVCWAFAAPVATLLRYDWNPPHGRVLYAFWVGIAMGLIQTSISLINQAMRGRYVIGSFDEIFGVITGSVITTAITMCGFLFQNGNFLPRTVPAITMLIASFMMLGGRFTVRSVRTSSARTKQGQRVLIYGAGDGGEQLVRQMLKDPNAEFTPVGFIDDNPRKRNLRIHGYKVLGNRETLPNLIRKLGISTVVVAIANVERNILNELDTICSTAGVRLSVIPTTSQLIDGEVKLKDISDVTNEDLLGRNPVSTDELAIREFLQNKRILITGAGGSIGSEIARQVSKYSPSYLGILDRDESAIHDVQLTIEGRGLLGSEGLILADIRDKARVFEVFNTVKPDVVFHAAALKHLTLLERYPSEALKTNVHGTANVLQAAQECGTQVFINISTDKAADPSSVLGRSKLITERLTAGFAQLGNKRYLSVRFGNVLGSRGSVLTAFRHQIRNGGPVTVTHPEVTRFFMTIPEAVHLVLQAAVIGEPSETLILDMGEPIRILDVARRLIEKSNQEIEIVFTGLRAGEKLDEQLISHNEDAVIRSHPKISHTKVSPLSLEDIQELDFY